MQGHVFKDTGGDLGEGRDAVAMVQRPLLKCEDNHGGELPRHGCSPVLGLRFEGEENVL